MFGAVQQFISLDFYENVLHYAISKKILHTHLNRKNWESRMFQFFAGDLYEPIPKTRDLFFATDPVDGECEATHNGLQVWKSHIETFNVSIHYECTLKIHEQKVAGFSMGLQMEIEGNPHASHVNFRLRNHDEFVHFEETPNFRI